MLTVNQLACSRGECTNFSDLSFAAAPSTCLHVPGEYGAGKATLLRTLVGLSPADAGQIHWSGATVQDRDAEFHRELTYSGQVAGPKGELTPLENLQLGMTHEGHRVSTADAMAARATVGLAGCASLLKGKALRSSTRPPRSRRVRRRAAWRFVWADWSSMIYSSLTR